MKTQSQKLEQVNRMIMFILTSGNNSVQMAGRWFKLQNLRSELKTKENPW